MYKTFEKKMEENKPTVALLAKPRTEFIDSKYEEIKPLITRVLIYVEKLKEYRIKTLEEVCDQLKLCINDFEDLLNRLNNYRTYVLKLPTPGYDRLYNILIDYELWLERIKKHISSPESVDSRSYLNCRDFLINSTVKNFEKIELILQEAIVTQKETIILDCNELVKRQQGSCSIS